MKNKSFDKALLGASSLAPKKSAKILKKEAKMPAMSILAVNDVLISGKLASSTVTDKETKKPAKIINEAKYSGAVTEYRVTNNPTLTRTRISTSGVYSIIKEAIVDTLPLSYGNAAKWTITVTNGVKFVSSEIIANWDKDGENLKYTEFGTNPISDDDGVFDVVVEKKNVLLKFIPVHGEWNVKTIRTVLGFIKKPFEK